MNQSSRFLAAVILMAGLVVHSARAERVQPLIVPTGPGVAPEELADLALMDRVERGATELRDRGYEELPFLAAALLDAAESDPRGQATPALFEQVRGLAPHVPSIRYRAARLSGDLGGRVAALRAVLRNAPSLHWLVTMGTASIGLALLSTACFLTLVGFIRSAPLHGHRLGHLTTELEPPAWPGVLGLCILLVVLPFWGIGPALIVGVAALIASTRMRTEESVPLLSLIVVLGLLLGPGVDIWSRLVVFPGHSSTLLAAWRIDRSQPIPGDRGTLVVAHERAPDDQLIQLALATSWVRDGELELAERLVHEAAEDHSVLGSRAANLLGMIHLARGDADDSIAAFQHALASNESAGVLYNLSQASGRVLSLADQATYFQAARGLDPELVAWATDHSSSNLHRHLLHTPVPLMQYLHRAFRHSPQAAAVSDDLRNWALGRTPPDWTWMFLPALALLGFLLRRTSVERCNRCAQPTCFRCGSEGIAGLTCVRCTELFMQGEWHDPKHRRLALVRYRRWERIRKRTVGAIGFCVPGFRRVLSGNFAAGGLQFFLLALAVMLLLSTFQGAADVLQPLPPPFELGEIATDLSVVLALLVLVPAYGFGLIKLGFRRRARRRA